MGLYGRARSIDSIPEAVVLIGLENLKKIVYSVSAEGLMRRQLPAYDYHAEHGFWLHALAVANASRVMAEAVPNCTLRGEEAFVAGLIHDVGKLVIVDFLPAGQKTVTLEDEKKTVGMHHAELAEYILKQWNLPETITRTVRYHHDFPDCEASCHGAAALRVAQAVCNTWGVGHKSPVDLSQDVPMESCTDAKSGLDLEGTKWDQVIWDIRQSLVGLHDTFK